MTGIMMGLMNNVQPQNVVIVNYTPLAGSLQFNGSTQFLSLSPGFALGTSAYTIEGWFYNNVNYTSQRALVSPQHSSGAYNDKNIEKNTSLVTKTNPQSAGFLFSKVR